jgi:ATP-dependent DNA helicase DinG
VGGAGLGGGQSADQNADPNAEMGAGGGAPLSVAEARRGFGARPLIVAHAGLSARRLGLSPPVRSALLLDVLELFAFVRPAQFCAPSAVGVARALGEAESEDPTRQAQTLRICCGRLLDELARSPVPSRAEAKAVCATLERGGWAWAPLATLALDSGGAERPLRGSGLDVWSRLEEWEDAAPTGEAGSRPVSPEEAGARLKTLLERAGLDEARPTQAAFAAETAFAFGAREKEG